MVRKLELLKLIDTKKVKTLFAVSKLGNILDSIFRTLKSHEGGLVPILKAAAAHREPIRSFMTTVADGRTPRRATMPGLSEMW